MVLTLEELNEAYSKSQRLLESLTQIPTLLADDEAWANERRSAFASLRRGLVDCITNGCLEAPIFGNRPIEDAFVFLLTLGLRSERRRDNVLLCFKCLRNSESWSLVLRGSRRCLELLKELPESFREDVLDAADASELLLLIAQSKKKKKKKSSKAAASVEIADSPDAAVPSERHQAPKEAGPLDLSPERAPEPARQSDFLAETSVSDSGVEVPKASQSCPEDLLAENSLSVSDSGVDMPKASRTCPQDLLAENSLSVSDSGADAPKLCPEDLLTEPSLSLSIHSPEPPQAPPTSPALPSAALQRPPRPCSMNIPTPTGPTPTRLRNFGGMAQQSPASKPRRPGSRKKDFEELGPRCPNGKPMTREMMIKEGQKRREDGSRTPTLRRLLSRGASSPPSGADTPSSILGRMKQKLLPSRATTPSPASRMSRTGGRRDFGGGDRFGVSKKE